MLAAYLTGIRQVEIRQAPEVRIESEDQVLLGVDVVGICGSDLHYYRTGRIGSQVVVFPYVIGHECACTVLETGRAASSLSAGDRVAVDPLVSCGRCDQCRAGRRHTCRNQRFLGCPGQAGGCLVQRIVMPAECCYKLPPQVDYLAGVLAEPLSIGMYSRQLAGLAGGEKVAILGSGPIGLSALLAVKAGMAAAVFMTDILDRRLAMAEQFHADWTGNPRKSDVVKEILRRQPGGLSHVFECAGEQETIDQGIELLGPGGKLMMLGIAEADRLSFDASEMRRKELMIQPVRRQNESVRPAIDLIASGQVDPRPMVTHHFDFKDSGGAFDLAADYRDGIVKAVIHVSK
ncbi:MAG: alcohol dehydrogenase catalytic domain-containing protein [Planctomycetes bacterium]|nr:alcohol dehydrogenase catalytic domain-containing protein [Planctomycetota bacterium]